MQQVEATTAAKQTEFFRRLLGDQEGWLNIASKASQRFRDAWFHYPDQLQEAVLHVTRLAESHDVYYCPNLYTVQKRNKEFIRQVTCAWSDLDTCDPSELLVRPSFVLETSPGRFQALWIFEDPQDMITGEDISHRIAYYHEAKGADTSGWDATQLLRVPFTTNHKPDYRNQDYRPTVKLVAATTTLVRPEDFKPYPPFPGGPRTLPQGAPQPPADLTGEQVMSKYSDHLSDYAQLLFRVEPTDDWSRALWNLECLLLEAGASPLETYVAARDSACNKYERDGKPAISLWKEIHKADEHVRTKLAALSITVEPPKPLLREGERTDYYTIIEEYIEWAKRQTDAVPSFHQASAFMILSGLLAGRIRLRMQHATYIPNLWFMILGGTTRTRKSTAMRFGEQILTQVAPEAIMATDGSIEGILATLANRPGEASVLQRDEFGGFLEAMKKKDYMAGAQQEFMKLYDGDMIKRRLRSGDIVVRDPVFILFTGGIRERILELMTEEHIASGFIPRFLFFLGEADKSTRRRARLFSKDDLDAREELIDKFTHIYSAFNVEQTVTTGHARSTKKRMWFASMDEDALERWNDLDDDLSDYADQSERPELFFPVVQRLTDSILKAALLIAAARAPGEPINITLEDMVHAIHYGEQWFYWSIEVIRNVGKTPYEEKLAKIHDYIYRHPGVPSALIMRTFRLNVQNSKLFIDTLEQRGMIRAVTRNKTRVYFSEEQG